MKLTDLVHSLPRRRLAGGRTGRRGNWFPVAVRRQMRGDNHMHVLEDKLRRYEEELLRLRVENEQLRRSSQAFGELAERLSTALQTASRVSRRPRPERTGQFHTLTES